MSKQLTITKRNGDTTVWTYSDDKLDFESWLQSDLAIAERWQAASNEIKEWVDAHPGEVRTEQSPAGLMFLEWADYADAIQEKK
jgi:hypothetical protein